jgi:hypothetical protein
MCSCIMIVIVVFAPIGSMILILLHKNDLNNEMSQFYLKYGTLIEGFKTDFILTASWNVVFMVRRLLTVFVLLYLIDFPAA